MGEWVNYRLGDIADVRWGDTGTTKAAYTAAGFPAYSASGRDGFLPTADYHQTGIVLSAIGAQCGRTWLAKGDWSCIKNTIRILASDPRVDIEYLYWYMQGNFSWPLRGSAQPFISQGDAQDVVVVLPNISYQRAIARLLGALDDKIAVNERIAATSVQLADAHFIAAVAGGCNESETFGSIASVHGGGTPRTSESSYWDGDIPWATPSDVTALSSPYLFSTGRRITDDGLANCASQLYPAGSIFMTSRATIGAFAISQMPAAVNQGFIVVVPPRPQLRWWLFHEMRSRVDEMIGLANGSTFLELSRKNFKQMPVRLASDEVVDEFHERVDPLHLRAAKCTEENQTLAQLRDTLLPKLMSGELRVRDAEKMVEDAT